MSADLLLTFNAGSSTVKISLFEATAAGGRRIARGVIDFRKTPLSFHVTKGPEAFEIDLKAEASEDLLEVLEETLGWLARHFDMSRVAGVGHRIVHGGDTFAGPVRVDDDINRGNRRADNTRAAASAAEHAPRPGDPASSARTRPDCLL